MTDNPDNLQRGVSAVGSGMMVPAAAGGGLAVGPVDPPGDYGSPPVGSEPEPGAEVSLSGLLRAKWLILGIFAVLSVLTVPWVWVLIKPTYEATASVRVSPVVPRVVFETEENVSAMGRFYSSFVYTQVSIIASPTVLERVLDNPAVQQTGWYQESPRTLRTLLGGGPGTHLERLAGKLKVEPRPHTELIDVSMRTLVAADAKVIVDAVVDEYKRYSDKALRETDTQRFATLRSEEATLQQEIDALMATKFGLSKQLGTGDPEGVRVQLATHLSELESEHDRLKREYALTQWELDSVKAPSGDGGNEMEGEPQRQYADDAEWRELNIALQKTRLELDAASQLYGDAHPRMTRLRSAVAHAEQLLLERELQVTARWESLPAQLQPTDDASSPALSRAQLERFAERQRKELELLEQEIAQHRSKVAQAGQIAADIARYDEEVSRKRGLYERVHSRIQVLDMESKAPARIGVAAYGVEASEPSRDRRLLLTLMALGGALMSGLAVAHLRGKLDPKVCEARDVQQTMHVPFLGQLPDWPRGGFAGQASSALHAECMRMIRTALLERLAGTGKRAVLITSAGSRSGKTSVAIELARSLAHLGKKTLLVDADLRRPSVADRIGLHREVGLAAVLTGRANQGEAVVANVVPGLDVLLAGDVPADFDPDLLADGVLSGCLNQWKKDYEYVLFDSPPILPVADARILAQHLDGTIMVSRFSHSRRSEVVQAFADVNAAGGTLLGTVLVGVRSPGRYGYGYGYGYDHEVEAESRPALKS